MKIFYMSLILGIFLLATPVLVNADPPTRVARLSYMGGSVIFAPAGQDEWVNAQINRPIITGDRLWSDTNDRGELQLGRAAIRFGASTSLTVLNLDNSLAQLQLTQGVLDINIRSMKPDQLYEIDTPNLAFSMTKPGDYRISVNTDGNETTVTVRSGQAEVYGDSASYLISAQQTYSFTQTNLENYQRLPFAANDAFDNWSYERERLATSSVSTQYVSPDVVGYEDLDRYGTWTHADVYGDVWIPNNVNSDWAPYREGQWIWIYPWGWTWVDHAEWGYAPFHYGRWAYVENRWGWIPGPISGVAIYAPALVGFLGGIDFALGDNGIGWFPLGYNDIYQPPYVVTPQYFSDINGSTFLRRNQVLRQFNRHSTSITFKNQQIANAVTAVSKTAFIQSQSVSKARVDIPKDALTKTAVRHNAALAPENISVTGSNKKSGIKPPAQVQSRAVIAKTTPPSPPVSFTSQKELLTKDPQKPLNPNDITVEKSTKGELTPQIKIVKPTRPTEPQPKDGTAKVILQPSSPSDRSLQPGHNLQQPVPARQLEAKPAPEVRQPERIQQPKPELKHPESIQPIPEMHQPEVRQPEHIQQPAPAHQPEARPAPEMRQPENIQPIPEMHQPEVRQPEHMQPAPAHQPEARQPERIQQSAPARQFEARPTPEVRQPEVRQPAHEAPAQPADKKRGDDGKQ